MADSDGGERMAQRRLGDQQPNTIVDPEPIRVSNLDQIQSDPNCLVKLQIGYAAFYLGWKDVAALTNNATASNRDVIIGVCHFKLTTEGRKVLRTVLSQAIDARTMFEQRHHQAQQEQTKRQVEAEWLRRLRSP
jgi:hypothetical protein